MILPEAIQQKVIGQFGQGMHWRDNWKSVLPEVARLCGSNESAYQRMYEECRHLGLTGDPAGLYPPPSVEPWKDQADAKPDDTGTLANIRNARGR